MSIRSKLRLLISILFVAAIGNALFTYYVEWIAEEKLEWVNHTNKVLIESERFLSSLKDTETGQRGYLLTNDSSYLQPYHAGLLTAEEHFQHIKELTKDNLDQQGRLTEIYNLMQGKFTELALTIELAQGENGLVKALDIVKDNSGKQSMDNLRGILNTFINAELLLLEARKGDYRADKAKVNTLIVIELIFFTTLAFITFSFMVNNLFKPLDKLLKSTRKTEEGKPLDVVDIVSNDEMGYLLSRFFKMSQKIQSRTDNLHHKANHDELTGLKNRTVLLDEIDAAIKAAKKNKSKCAVFFIDLNDFKILNDTLGHDAGDAMLVETAARLKQSVRIDDIVFRIGGDEFVVLIKDVYNVDEVHLVISKLLSIVAAPVTIAGKATEIKLSVGVATSPDDADSGEELVKYADIAMYEAKQGKEKSNFKFFDKTMVKRSSDNKG